ncbi:MAG TPA: phosphate ABC transporter permease subunit PstC [Spirochaetia bacterium]|nr:phosphate ABC transporter permease subunit PstC [Spirochaetia bacterium]
MKAEKVFRGTLSGTSYIVMILIGGIFLTLLIGAWPSIVAFKLPFLFTTVWDPVKENFGAATFIVGTLLTSFMALLISIPFSLSIALLLGEYYRSGIFSRIIRTFVDLLASVPSVVYGLWGIAVLIPAVRLIERQLHVVPYGVGMFTAAVILAIMILPYSASIAIEVIKLVPDDLRSAGFAIGATRREMIFNVVFPYARSGILAGFLLSLGRALGETMAVTLVIGNVIQLPKTIFSPGNTLASVIASQFTEANGSLHLAAMIELALVLFIITTIINGISHQVIIRLGGEVHA